MNYSPHVLVLGLTTLMFTACGSDHKKPPKENIAPQASAASFHASADTAYTGTLKGTDAENDKLHFTIATMPTNGMVVIKDDGSFTYTPNADTTGSDKFSFTVSDGINKSLSADVNITIDLLQVNFGEYSRSVFKQNASADPLSINSRTVSQDVTADTAYDDLLENL